MPQPPHYSCIFFDFDGVIVDSVEAKITAFGELYDPFGPGVRARVEAYQRAVPGETRFAKIPHFHREFVGTELSPEEVSQWCDRLSGMVLEQVIACPLMEDVSQVLALLAREGVAAHIVSGTPQSELETIVDRKGLTPFFQSVRGSPESKVSITLDIMGREGLDARNCLFVGDAMMDFEAALECGMDFLGRAETDPHPFPAGTQVVERLGEYFGPETIGERVTPDKQSKAA